MNGAGHERREADHADGTRDAHPFEHR
jgi:hypothetical protein